MYTIVLAAVLATGNDVPDFGRRGGCRGCWGGCYGCWGGCWGGCYGGCWGGCYGGCWGGCYGGCYGGCWGVSYGGCWGCYGCGGGCYGCGGGVVVPASGGCGGVVVPASGGCGGMTSSGGSRAGGAAGSGGQGGGSTQLTQSLQELKQSVETLKKEQTKIRLEVLKQVAEELKRKASEEKIDELRRIVEELRRRLPPPKKGPPPPPPSSELPSPQPGKVLLTVPDDALVFINDKRIDTASAFLTPPLQAGQEYVVKVEAAVVRDGKNIHRVQRLPVHAGEVVRLAYKDMGPAEGRWTPTGRKTAAPARITVRLPAEARLTVHGVACPLTSDTRTFETPPLKPGQTYYYLLKAEVTRDGQPIAQTRRVAFRSGERVRVSFEDLGVPSLTAR